MGRTKLSLDDLRTRLSVRLAVAPRHWFRALWEPKTRAYQRDEVRRELVEFITHGWESLEIEAEATHDTQGHSVPATQRDG